MLFSSGLIAGGALMGVGVAALILGAGRFEGLANLLEAVRRDGIHVATPAEATTTIDGVAVAPGDTLPVRSRWFENDVAQPDGSSVKKRELQPAIERGGAWKPFQTLVVEVRAPSGDHDRQVLEYDPEARGRTIRFEPIDTWDAPILVESLGPGIGEGTLAQWLVAEGDDVAFGAPVARVDTAGGPIEIKAAQSGRLAKQEVAPGGKVQVRTGIGQLELVEPPISSAKTPEPLLRRRIVVESRPGSDAAALGAFLVLCAVLVWSALPRKRT
jgi:hypothetical protein